MKITRTGELRDGVAGGLITRGPGAMRIAADEKGKLGVRLDVWIPGQDGQAEKCEVALSDGDIERLLGCLANPREDQKGLVANTMKQNLRSILRLSALGAGVLLDD